MNTAEAMRKRWAARAFISKEVSRRDVVEILDAARWAPSGSNIQPWKVAALTGQAKQKLGAALAAARSAGEPQRPDFEYYPGQWSAPYDERRKACGLALYAALEIKREDKARRMEAWLANYDFFGAPVGLVFMMDRALNLGSLLDMGMFIQNVALAAMDKGLATCPQAAIAEYPDIVRRLLGAPESAMVVCGMALGWPDPAAPVNRYRTERAPVEEFAAFHD